MTWVENYSGELKIMGLEDFRVVKFGYTDSIEINKYEN